MELESPADAWFVWFGVALVSLAFVGVVASFPAEPPPDTPAVANAIDRTTASGYNATAEYEHDADKWYVANKTVVLKNDGGTTRESLSYARVVPVWPDDDLEAVLHGAPPSGRFADPDAFRSAVVDASDEAEDSITNPNVPKWRIADGRLVVRHVTWGDKRATLVDL